MSIHGPQQTLNFMDLPQDVVQNTVSVVAMVARKEDNPAKAIHNWMSALCKIRKEVCLDDWYRLALAAFGYEWTPPSAPKAVFRDHKVGTRYSDTLGKETPAPVAPSLPFKGKGFKTWKALFNEVCSLFINGLDETTMHIVNIRSVDLGKPDVSCYSLPLFTAPGVDALAKQLSDPSTSQDTLDTMLRNILNVMSCKLLVGRGPSVFLEFEKLCLHGEGMLSTDTSPLMAGVTLLHMRGARSPMQIVKNLSDTITTSLSLGLMESSPASALSRDFEHMKSNWVAISSALTEGHVSDCFNNAISIFALDADEMSENSLTSLKGSVVNFLENAYDVAGSGDYPLVSAALDKFGRNDAFKIGEVEGAGTEGTRTPLEGFKKYMESLNAKSKAAGANNEWVPYIRHGNTLYWLATDHFLQEAP
jgi:hypothetical protein